MQKSWPKIKLAALLVCFIIALSSTSCKSPQKGSYMKNGPTWQEPTWIQAGTEDIHLQWKFAPKDKAQYYQIQKATIASEGKTTGWEQSVTLQYHVKEVSNEGTAQVFLSCENLDTKVVGSEIFTFLPCSLRNVGSFSIAPSGHMTDITGVIGIRSLPTFPNDPLKIGSQWTDNIGILITPTLPRAIMTGKCTYHLVGLADVEGHKWAKITFEGTLELSKQEVMHKVIGVKPTEKPTKDEQGVSVGEVVAGSPAEKAGILQGDIILSFGSMPVNTWLDLIVVIAKSSHDKPVEVVIFRDKVRKKLFVKPRVASSGQIELKGSIKGMFVFDVTMGGIVRMQINPFSRRALIQVGDKTTEREVHVESLMQLVKYSTQMRGNNSRTK
jgi:membrane-associated protease RseP (regulator of RpoE activity)